ncbi:MAG: Na+/H+ antiporter subunit D [Bacteroidales bacterium]
MNNSVLLIAPILFPLLVGLLTLATWKLKRIQELIALGGAFVFLVISVLLLKQVLSEGILHLQAGNWKAPFGITIVADTFSAVMVLITSVMGFGTALYSISSIDIKKYSLRTPLQKRRQFAYYPVLNVMYMGICGAFLTGDLFNMYVWFEVMLISSFILLAMDGSKIQMEGTFKYVTINLVSSAFFLIGIGFLYGLTGTLNMADLAVKVAQVEDQSLVTLVAMFFLISFGIKAAIFPLFFWLPASYHTPPISVAAIFAGMLTKVGVYSLIRVFTLIFIQDVGYTHTILLWIAGLTMFVGVLGAASQYDMKKILSFHIISQIGYMVLGLALFTPLAVAGGIFYIMHHIIVKGNLFFVAGLAHRLTGYFDIRKMGVLVNSYPFLAVLFLIPALSLAGMPPLSGFWAKFLVIKAGLDAGEFFVVGVALLVGLLTLFSMMKIWNEAFWKKPPREKEKCQHPVIPGLFSKYNIYMTITIMMLASITLVIGFYPEPFFRVAQQAASELMDPSVYINTVLGGNQ